MEPKDIINAALTTFRHEELAEPLKTFVEQVVTQVVTQLHESGVLDDRSCPTCHMNDLACPNCQYQEFSQCSGCGTTTVCELCAEDAA